MFWAVVRTTRPQGDLSRARGTPGIQPVRPRLLTLTTAGGAPRKLIPRSTLTGPGGRKALTPKTNGTSEGGRLISPGDGAIPERLSRVAWVGAPHRGSLASLALFGSPRCSPGQVSCSRLVGTRHDERKHERSEHLTSPDSIKPPLWWLGCFSPTA